MVSETAAHPAPVAQRIEEVSGIRPVTLLVAFGIVVIIGILISAGIAANHLRTQALDTTESELGRIDGVLSSAARLTLNAADTRLAQVATRLAASNDAGSLQDRAASPDIDALMRVTLGGIPRLDAIAIMSADGLQLASAGAWPAADPAIASAAKSLFAETGRTNSLGPVIKTANGNSALPILHRVPAGDGVAGAAVIGLIPATAFSELYAETPLAADAAIALIGPDGTIVARYPVRPGMTASAAERANLDVVFRDPTATMVRHATDDTAEWRIEAVHALPDYPLAVMVSRSADRALAGWQRQGIWFGAFALAGALVIGVMVYMIAYQFETHSTLTLIRAEKIEVERAQLAAEAELLKAERLSVLGQLTATVAHELRNPLSAIRNTLFTVKELAANSGVKLDRPIARMERSIERCDRIISDLLEYTRHRELNRSTVPFDKWLADVIGEQQIAEPIKVVTELGAEEVLVPLNSDRVRRVVINLVENAAQALGDMPADREKQITLKTAAQGPELVLCIEDTGPGISPENLAKIFEPLFSTKSFGTGLGLPTVRQIVNQHGGMITVDSEVGTGTVVTVRLPLQPDAAANVKVAA